MRSLAFLLFLALSSGIRAESASDFVDTLYRQPNSELHYPTKAALKLYGSGLRGLIEKAIAIRAEADRKHPDEKPPFADYSLLNPSADAYKSYKLFTAKPEEAENCLIIVQLLQDPKDNVEPDFVYLYLQRFQKSWNIREIRYHSYTHGLKKFETSLLSERLRSDIQKNQ